MLNGCTCPEPWTLIFQTEDRKQHETCDKQAGNVLRAIVDEFGDQAPVWVSLYVGPDKGESS